MDKKEIIKRYIKHGMSEGIGMKMVRYGVEKVKDMIESYGHTEILNLSTYDLIEISKGIMQCGSYDLRRSEKERLMQIVTPNNNNQPLPNEAQIKQFLDSHNATGFALFCWNADDVGKSFGAMAAGLKVFSACEGIHAEDNADLALQVLLRLCRRDAVIRDAEKQKAEEILELVQKAA